MANELRQHAALLQGITTTLGLVDSDDGVVMLNDQLAVMLNPWAKDTPELALHRQDFLFAFRIVVGAGGAGNNSIAQLHNDSADAIVIVEAWSSVVITGPLFFGRTSTLATTDNGLVATARDGRYVRAAVPYVRSRSQNNAAVPAGFTNGIMGQSNNNIMPFADSAVVSCIIRPGGTFFVFNNTVNEAMVINWVGRARRLVNTKEVTPSP